MVMKQKKDMIKVTLTLFLFLISLSAHAYEIPEKDCGIAVGVRSANIPYPAEEERVQDLLRTVVLEVISSWC